MCEHLKLLPLPRYNSHFVFPLPRYYHIVFTANAVLPYDCPHSMVITAVTAVLLLSPVLNLNDIAIPVIEETKFLGIIFDRKLSFIPHLRHLKDKCMKALNLLPVLAHIW